VPDAHRADAERSAEEAYVLALLRHRDVSAGRAAELLHVNRAELSALMYRHGISPFDETLSRAELDQEARDRGT
jgi:predicted HTH domain antitoxin